MNGVRGKLNGRKPFRMPLPKGQRHVASPQCWCQPNLSYDNWATDGQVWVHKEAQA